MDSLKITQYQESIIDAIREKIDIGANRIIVDIPSACSKEDTICEIAKAVCPSYGLETLVLLNDDESIKLFWKYDDDMLSMAKVATGSSFLHADEKLDQFDFVILSDQFISTRMELMKKLKKYGGTVISVVTGPLWEKENLNLKLPVIVVNTEGILCLKDYKRTDEDEQELVLLQLQDIYKEAGKNIEDKMSVLNADPVAIDIIENAVDELERLRSALHSELISHDSNIKAMAIKKLVDGTVAAFAPLFDSKRFLSDENEITAQLKAVISPDVWSKLSEESRKLLVTANYTLDCIKHNAKLKISDCSPICMLISKAFENEIEKRYYGQYTKYLYSNSVPEKNWPSVLRGDIEGGGLLGKDNFILKYALTAAGVTHDKRKGDISIENETNFKNFIKYFSKNYLPKSYSGNIEQKVLEDCKTIDYVRVNYIKPIADEKSVDLASAEKCMAYVVTKSRKLSEILKDLTS